MPVLVAGQFDPPQMVWLTVAHVGGAAGDGAVLVDVTPPGAPVDPLLTGGPSPPVLLGPCTSVWFHYVKSTPDAPDVVEVEFEVVVQPG